MMRMHWLFYEIKATKCIFKEMNQYFMQIIFNYNNVLFLLFHIKFEIKIHN